MSVAKGRKRVADKRNVSPLATKAHPGPDGSYDVPLPLMPEPEPPDPDREPPEDLDVCPLCEGLGEICLNPSVNDPQHLEFEPCPCCNAMSWQ